MKSLFTCSLLTLFICTGFLASAQSGKSKGQLWENVRRSTIRAPWIAGLGWNVIDDDGKPFNHLFDANGSWNVVPYPSKLSCEKILIQGWSVEFAANYNQLKSGKRLNNDILKSTQTFISADINGKFSFAEFAPKLGFFDPYVLHGFGYTYRGAGANPNVATANVGLGFNCWVYDNMIGINVQSQAKFAIKSPLIKTSGNYLQHSLGIVYKFETGQSRYGQKPGRMGSKYKFFKTRAGNK